MVAANEPTLPERRRLAFAGVVSVAVAMNSNGGVVDQPVVTISGLPVKSDDGESMLDIVADAVDDLLESLPRAKRRDPDAVRTALERAVRAAVAEEWDKKPTCHVAVLTV